MFSTSLSSITEYEYGPWIDYDLSMGNIELMETVQVQFDDETLSEAEQKRRGWPYNYNWLCGNILRYRVVRVVDVKP